MKKLFILALIAIFPTISNANPFGNKQMQEFGELIGSLLLNGFNGFTKDQQQIKLQNFDLDSITFPPSLAQCREDLLEESHGSFIYAVEFGDDEMQMYARLDKKNKNSDIININWCVYTDELSLRLDLIAEQKMVSLSDTKEIPTPAPMAQFLKKFE